MEHVDVAISVHGFGHDGFALWIAPDSGLIIEAHGPTIRGRQTGPLRGIIVSGLNAPLLDAARKLLGHRFADFHVADWLQLGFHPENPVNPPRLTVSKSNRRRVSRGIGDFGEALIPREDGTVIEVVAALVELAAQAAELMCATTESTRHHLVR